MVDRDGKNPYLSLHKWSNRPPGKQITSSKILKYLKHKRMKLLDIKRGMKFS